MKKASVILVSLSFVFALSAIVIATGGTYLLKQQADSLERGVQEQLTSIDEEASSTPTLPEGYELNETTEPVPLALEELGFTFTAPNEWGAFEPTHQPGTFKGEGSYFGSFTNIDIKFSATNPNFVLGRGAYYADILGYRKTSDAFEANFLNQTWVPIKEDLVQGEVKTTNGSVLVISSDTEAQGPVMFSDEEGVRFAILNLPANPVPGGVFRAGADVSQDEFRLFLESLEFVEN